MQTFLPFPNLEKSVSVLDNSRLGKQRVEAAQMYKALTEGSRWINHPATQMWRGYEDILAVYHNLCIMEWVKRGKNNSMELLPTSPLNLDPEFRKGLLPWWFGHTGFHGSHQSNLLRKNSRIYGKHFKVKDPNWLYLWPYPDKKVFRIIVPAWAKDSGYCYIPPVGDYEGAPKLELPTKWERDLERYSILTNLDSDE